MFSIGTDIIEIERIKNSMTNKKFFEYVFGKEEYEMLETKNFSERSVAANFCAKEAFFKSLGTGIRGYGLKNVQILRDELGKPYFKFRGKVFDEVERNGYKFSVSLSHSKEYALATVLCYTE